MSSGTYSALSGNIARMKALDSYANNLANANTFGYKKDRLAFESYLNEATQIQAGKGINFTRIQRNFVDFSQGTNLPTGGDFDFAIEGEGFFKVKRGDDSYYTRLGKFHLDVDGTLITTSGLPVVSENGQPITIPNPDVAVDEQGRILDDGSDVGRIAIFTVEDFNLLVKEGEGLFSLASTQGDNVVDTSQILQGHLEGSNVNIVEEMALMMDGLRAFEAYQKMIKRYGTIKSKADELGSL